MYFLTFMFNCSYLTLSMFLSIQCFLKLFTLSLQPFSKTELCTSSLGTENTVMVSSLFLALHLCFLDFSSHLSSLLWSDGGVQHTSSSERLNHPPYPYYSTNPSGAYTYFRDHIICLKFFGSLLTVKTWKKGCQEVGFHAGMTGSDTEDSKLCLSVRSMEISVHFCDFWVWN